MKPWNISLKLYNNGDLSILTVFEELCLMNLSYKIYKWKQTNSLKYSSHIWKKSGTTVIEKKNRTESFKFKFPKYTSGIGISSLSTKYNLQWMKTYFAKHYLLLVWLEKHLLYFYLLLPYLYSFLDFWSFSFSFFQFSFALCCFWFLFTQYFFFVFFSALRLFLFFISSSFAFVMSFSFFLNSFYFIFAFFYPISLFFLLNYFY